MRITPLLSASFIALAPISAIASSYSIDDWFLSVGIVGNFPNQGAGFFDVIDPFVDSHAVSLSNSAAAASYSFWNEQGRFFIEADIAADAESNSSLLSGASGDIMITPTEDLVIQYTSVYDVTLPAHFMTSQLNLGVLDLDTNETLLNVTRVADTVIAIGPRHFELGGEFVMPAGRTWTISYSFDILAAASSSGNLGVGSGFVEFVIVPEPSTLLLAAPLVLLLARRRIRRAA